MRKIGKKTRRNSISRKKLTLLPNVRLNNEKNYE